MFFKFLSELNEIKWNWINLIEYDTNLFSTFAPSTNNYLSFNCVSVIWVYFYYNHIRNTSVITYTQSTYFTMDIFSCNARKIRHSRVNCLGLFAVFAYRDGRFVPRIRGLQSSVKRRRNTQWGPTCALRISAVAAQRRSSSSSSVHHRATVLSPLERSVRVA